MEISRIYFAKDDKFRFRITMGNPLFELYWIIGKEFSINKGRWFC